MVLITKCGDFVIVKENLDSYIEPIGLIKRILLANNLPVFEMELFNIVSFEKNINCVKVKSNLKKEFRYYNQLVHKQELNSIYLLNGEYIIQIRFFFNLIKHEIS